MANMNQKAKQPEKSDKKTPLGHGHEDITDDFSALLNVFGIEGFSTKLKQKALKMVRR